MDTRLSPSAPRRSPPPPVEPDEAPVGPGEPWESVLAGVREAVLICDAAGVVTRANAPAHAMLPDLVVGELVDVARCRPLTDAVHAGDAELTVDLPPAPGAPGGARRVSGWSRRIADDAVCWYLLDVSDEHRRADSLLAAQDRAQFLSEAGRALHGVLHLDRTVRTVVALAVPRLATAALVLVNAGGDTVRWARADADRPRPETGELPLAALRATPHVRAALLGDGPADPWAAIELGALDVWGGADPGVGLLAVPVPVNGVAHAVLVLAADPADVVDAGPAPRDAGIPALVTEYASRAGTALAAAALFREQSHLGGVLQQSLAPPPLPRGSGGTEPCFGAAYRPAREGLRVGGDFYEVLPPATPDATTSFLLGDVCGKGIEAAVLSGRVRQSLHALRLVERRPRALLDLLNTALLDAAAAYGEAPRFATMVLGDVVPGGDGGDGGDGGLTLRLATGGHPPPLVVRTDGTVDVVDVTGTLVGALREASFAETRVALGPGDTCVLYSDGLTEARGPAGFYGEERLQAALGTCGGVPAPVLCERLVQLISEWLDGGDHDDIAVLAVQAPTVEGTCA